MSDRDIAFQIVDSNIQNKNLVKHCLAVEATMRALAKHFGEDEEVWGLAGLLHEADWEVLRDKPHEHTKKTIEWMKEKGIQHPEIIQTILSHNYLNSGEKAPETKMEWSLFCCDELTGLITADALIRPEKKLSFITVESVIKRFNTPKFAAPVDRNQIKLCEEKLGIPLNQFIEISLTAMQHISQDLGL